MHKTILKLFVESRSFIQFLKIVVVFMIMLLFLYWTQNLINAEWTWLAVFKPILDTFINIGEFLSDKSINLFDAVFEFKYFIAFLLMLGLYVILDWSMKLSDKVQDVYETGYEIFRKAEENKFNQSLQNSQVKEQKKLQGYSIYVSVIPRTDRVSKLMNVDIEEQKRAMNKFLISQTGVAPKEYEGGFLYEFQKFDDIDLVLPAFFKLLASENPVDYNICTALSDGDLNREKLNKLISLENINKITMFSDMVYRYGFTSSQNYQTSMIGVFQNNNENFEVYEFVNNI